MAAAIHFENRQGGGICNVLRHGINTAVVRIELAAPIDALSCKAFPWTAARGTARPRGSQTSDETASVMAFSLVPAEAAGPNLSDVVHTALRLVSPS